MNFGLAVAMGVVIAIFFVVAARYIFGHHGGPGYFWHPFYDPAMEHEGGPRRDIDRGADVHRIRWHFDVVGRSGESAKKYSAGDGADMPVIGILSAIQVYAAQLIWPASEAFPNVDTAFVHVAARAWHPMFIIVGLTLLVANFGSGMGAQLGAASLLYGMGRSEAIPKAFFGKVDPKRHVPRNNVLFVGLIALGGAFVMSYALGTEMLNFGALIAFMGVNAAAFALLCSRGRKENHPLYSACDGILHLPFALGESEPYGDHCGRHLDGRRN